MSPIENSSSPTYYEERPRSKNDSIEKTKEMERKILRNIEKDSYLKDYYRYKNLKLTGKQK